MPTGLTHGIYDGTDDFNDFVWRCARSMFYDDSMPRDLIGKVPQYLVDRVAQARASLSAREAMTLKQVAKVQEKQRFDVTQMQESLREHDARVLARYDAMRQKVEGWDCAPFHEGLKQLMLKQIDESRSRDCGGTFSCDLEALVPPEVYRQRMIQDAREALEHCEKELAAAVTNAERATLWLQTLNAVIPMPADGK